MIKGFDYPGLGVVYFCHDGKGKFVMHLRGAKARDENGKWDIGAGGVDFGDTVEGTLRKEIKEEYGADVLAFEFLGYRDVHREHLGKPTHWLTLDFKVLVDPGQVVNNEPHKIDDVQWFSLETMPANIHSQIPYFLQLYRERLT